MDTKIGIDFEVVRSVGGFEADTMLG